MGKSIIKITKTRPAKERQRFGREIERETGEGDTKHGVREWKR